MYDERHITHDAPSIVEFDETTDGITTDDEGNTAIDWDSVERVSLETTDSFETPPHASAFDTSEFYRLTATVARPIPQPYLVDSSDSSDSPDESVVWLKKPRAELQRAAWSLDNRPWTLDHPDTGLVASVDDVRGFWDDSYYLTTSDELKSHLHIPVGDEEAKSYVEDNNEVSVGFRNRVTATDAYDDAVGGEGPDVSDDYERDIAIDGYQTDIYFDHVASVERGRCGAEDGCGLNTGTGDGDTETVADTYKRTVITELSDTDEAQTTAASAFGTAVTADANGGATSVLTQKEQSSMAADSKFVNPDDDRWYAVPPSDNPDDEWKFPITSCDGEDSVDSAWHFAIREMGDISVSWDLLKERIRRRANELDCDMELNESTDTVDSEVSDADFTGTSPPDVSDTDMTCNCNTDDGGLSVDFDDLAPKVALDKIAAENDSIESYLTELRAAADAAEDAAEEVDADVTELPDAVSVLDERVTELDDRVEELQRPQMEADAEAILDCTERFGDTVEEVIEACDDDPETLSERRDMVEDLADSGTSETTANTDSTPEDDDDGLTGSRHVVTPEAWE
jgi:hypothetical protein